MSVINGLGKMFSKRERFASPHEYMLTPKEKEGVIVFFSVLAIVILTITFLLVLN